MFKKTILIPCLFLSAATMANPVTRRTAMQEAQKFLQNKPFTSQPLKIAKRASATVQCDDTASFYVFNRGTDNGFVVVSGDDRTTPILGYSDNGSFDADNVPDNVQAWLDGYVRAISHLDTTAATTIATKTNKAPAVTHNTITPLLQTYWMQNSPYNLLCPSAPTGCTATAMAQVMYYYKWPQTATTSIPAYSDYYGTKRDSLPPTTFDWDNMLLFYYSNTVSTDAQKNAIAKLMQYCGWASKMSYATTSSGAYIDDACYGMANYLGYDGNTIRDVMRDSYTATAWDNLMYNELAAGRPVIYSGYTTSNAGHTFVCDGYSSDNFYHINWGWGGNYDGYFLLNVLDSNGDPASANGYSTLQECIIGIQPGSNPQEGTVSNTNGQALQAIAISTTQTSITRSTSTEGFVIPSISVQVKNSSTQTGIYYSGVGLYNADDVLQSVPASSNSIYTSYWKQYSTFNDLFANASIGAGITSGTYLLKPVSRRTANGEWVKDFGADKYNITAIIDGNNLTLYVNPCADSLTVEGYSVVGSLTSGSSQRFMMKVHNKGINEFDGKLYLNGYNAKGQRISFGNTTGSVPAGKTATVAFVYTPSAVGSYALTVSADSWAAQQLPNSAALDSVVIKAASSSFDLSATVDMPECISTGTDKYVLYGKTLTCNVNVTNNGGGSFSNGYIVINFVNKATSDSYTPTNWYFYTSIAGGVTSKYTFSNSLTALSNGTYNLNIKQYQYAVGEYKNVKTVELTIADGAVMWKADGSISATENTTFTVPNDVAAISVNQVSKYTITPNANPNTLYFMASTDSVIPEALSGKNVVKGSYADNITLTDGYNFYTPKTFTAATITYTRSFDKFNTSGTATATGGLSTLVIPFTPQTITSSEGRALSAYLTPTDTGKDLWLYEFNTYDTNTGTMTFSYATYGAIIANRPYIVAVPSTTPKLTFSATEARIATGASVKTEGGDNTLIGTYMDNTLTGDGLYVINDAGTNFTNVVTATVSAFRAYFLADICNAHTPQFIFNTESTGIETPAVATTCSDVFTLTGIKLRSAAVGADALYGLPHGIYIVGGRKVLK